jgi:hypothetical protein
MPGPGRAIFAGGSVSRLVHVKYAMTREAPVALGTGTALCIAAVIVNAVITRV